MNKTQERLLEMVMAEADGDQEFRAALLEALGASKAPASRKPKTPAPIDPIRSWVDGTLETDLEGLDTEELHAVIREYRLDSARQTVRWSADHLRPYIISRARARATQGNVFLHFQG